jgi:hypothetical protein
MLPHQRLLEWFKLEDQGQQLAEFASVFTAGARLDEEFSTWDQVRPMVEITAALRDVRPVLADGDDTKGAVVLDARDPVTNMWHRVAWVFSAQEGLISRVISTTSRSMPSPEDGATREPSKP